MNPQDQEFNPGQLDMITPVPQQDSIWNKDIPETPLATRGLRSFQGISNKKISKTNLFDPSDEDKAKLEGLTTGADALIVDDHGTTRPRKFINHRFLDDAQGVPEDHYPVVEIFKSIEGEGLHLGTPRVLVRAGGCAVGCSWCDTPHTWALKHSTTVPIEYVAQSIIKRTEGRVREISFTGGEPLHYPRQLLKLGRMLKNEGFRLNLETSGIAFHQEVFELFDYISMDIKTPSSGVFLTASLLEMLRRVYDNYEHAQFKAVILDENDLKFVADNLQYWYKPQAKNRRPLILTPGVPNTKKATSDGKLGSQLADVIDMILLWNEGYNIRAVPQVHALLQFR